MFEFGKKKDHQDSGTNEETQKMPKISPEEWMRRVICMNMEGAELQKDCVFVPETGMKIWTEFWQSQPQMLQMALHCSHPEFTDEIEEFLVAPGDDITQQLQELADQVMELVLIPVLSGLSGGAGEKKTVTLLGTEHSFSVGRSHIMSRFRDQEAVEKQVPSEGLFNRFETEVLAHVGRKNNYWIKLYESHFGDEINCEVRIKNRIIPELTALLTEDVKKYAVTDWDQKQTVLLWQDKETRVEQPFTAAQVKEYAGQAIHLFAEKIEYDDIYDRILRMTGDESLSCELFFLLPEIFCLYCIQDMETSSRRILLCSPGKQDPPAVHESQIGCYNWLCEAVERYLSEERPDNSVLLEIINLSSSAKAISAAIQNGSDLKNLRQVLAVSVPDGYVLR